MSSTALIKNIYVVNEGQIKQQDVYIKDQYIDQIADCIDREAHRIINGKNKYLLPGIIDDQVHFREPGLDHKADIYTEAKAAVAGGTTSFMEMPNTKPNTLTQSLLEEKYLRAAKVSLANFSFFMGASNDNIEEVLKTNPKKVCGVKVFMGSSTGNMLVDNKKTLEKIFSKVPMLIATHCEDEQTIKKNEVLYKQEYGEDIPIEKHPIIRSEQACYLSSSLAIQLAKKYNTRLHILHISTEKELDLFDNKVPLSQKRITAEVCVHHLWFDATDYPQLQTQIKCNPAIKASHHKKALLQGLLADKLDIIATDHAPHTWKEKNQSYFNAPSGVPLVQHALQMMLELYKKRALSIEKIVEKMCHAPAICFEIEKRGFIREGYFADLVIVDLEKPYTVNEKNIHYKCAWSPFKDYTFSSSITHTFVSGHLAFCEGIFDEKTKGMRLTFSR